VGASHGVESGRVKPEGEAITKLRTKRSTKAKPKF